MKFEHDPKKSKINLKKHGITLEQARSIWEAPYVELEAKNVDEPRFMVVGKIGGKCYSCICTNRNGVTRLISARRSRKNEEALYYEYIKA